MDARCLIILMLQPICRVYIIDNMIVQAVSELFDGSVNHDLLVRRLTVTAMRVADEKTMHRPDADTSQLELFVDYDKLQAERKKEKERKMKRERSLQQALLRIKDTYGKNAILRGPQLCGGSNSA